MLRVWGAGCIVIAASLMGERAARTQQEALATVDALLISFTVLEAEIGYLASDLEECFYKAAATAPKTQGLYHGVASKMRQGKQVTEAWQHTSATWGRFLPPRPRQILSSLCAAWGPWQAEDHIRHIQLAQKLLQIEQEAMRSKLDSTCRLRRYLGVGSGMILALLLY